MAEYQLSVSQNNITYYYARQSRAEPQTELAFPRSRFNLAYYCIEN